MFRAALKHDVKLTTNIRASTAQYGTKVYLVPRQYLSSINTLACLSHHDRDCQPRTEGIAGHAKARPFCAYARSRTASSRPEDAKDVSVPKPPLSIVFTDIVKSTTIWEKDADTMAQAMTIHDDLVRELINAHRGYEVKQNGDGFMIAFQSAICALRFCLDVQVKLQDQDWPTQLLELGPAQPVIAANNQDDSQSESLLWRGLRLRMSAHFGDVVCNWNDVIHRMDYLGPAVNRAARYISVCEGGQVIVSEEFLDTLQDERAETLVEDGPLYANCDADDSHQQKSHLLNLQGLIGTEFEICVLGDRHFKGVPEKQKLYFIVPKSLHGRLEYFPKHTFVQASKGNLV